MTDTKEQYQPTMEELVAVIKEIKEKNPDFGIKRVFTELKVVATFPISCGGTRSSALRQLFLFSTYLCRTQMSTFLCV